MLKFKLHCFSQTSPKLIPKLPPTPTLSPSYFLHHKLALLQLYPTCIPVLHLQLCSISESYQFHPKSYSISASTSKSTPLHHDSIPPSLQLGIHLRLWPQILINLQLQAIFNTDPSSKSGFYPPTSPPALFCFGYLPSPTLKVGGKPLQKLFGRKWSRPC